MSIYDRVVADELHKVEVTRVLCTREQLVFWTREYLLWPWPRVRLHQWSGTRWSHSTTGRVIEISVPRYWWLWWSVWRHRRSLSRRLPSARVVK
jgi:hypothetical protein